VAVTVADLTAPTGELQASWFSTPSLATAAGIWIVLGADRVPEGATSDQSDAVVTAYVYWRGYGDVLMRMARDPNSVSIDKGDISASYAADQRKYFAAKVAEWKSAYDVAVNDVTAVAAVIDNAPRSSSSQQILRSF
jgi:hypothetical protein